MWERSSSVRSTTTRCSPSSWGLLARIWKQDSSSDVQRVRTLVKDLRVKLGDNARNPTYILTVPGVGYCAATP